MLRASLALLLGVALAGCTVSLGPGAPGVRVETASEGLDDAPPADPTPTEETASSPAAEGSTPTASWTADNVSSPSSDTAPASNASAAAASAGANATAAPPPGTNATENATARPPAPKHFAETFRLALGQAGLLGAGVAEDCVRIEARGNVTLLDGTANATWTEASFGSGTLDLAYEPPEGNATAVTGGSPLVVALPRTVLAPDEAAVLSVRFPDDATALQQDVALAVAFDYVGTAPDVAAVSC